ncbi:MAG: hypothetical protein IJU25_01850, partial [Lachnospiraceae bacterium]|nr:hypothetical protein [Lachnospiraceae bacterium]
MPEHMPKKPGSYKNMLIPAALLLIACVLYRKWSPGTGSVGDFARSVQETAENRFECTYEEIAHDVIVDLPAEAKGAPLVLMLHGYGNSAESMRGDTGFEKAANPRGYAVAYVTGAADPADPTAATGW